MDKLSPLTPEVVIGGETGKVYRQSLADSFDDSRTWVDGSNKRLSDRIWSARQIDQQMISHTLKDGIVTGRSANEVAKELTRYYDPAFGGGNYAARRLARTEITRSLGAGTIDAQKRNPFSRGVKWALSGSHPRSDLCDPNAGEDQFKLGEGVYPVTQVPRYPAHPNCLCTLIPVNDPRKDKVFDKILKDLEAKRARSAQSLNPPPRGGQNRQLQAQRRAARRQAQAATPEPVPVGTQPASVPKPSIKDRLADPKWMPDNSDIDEAIAVAKQQKQIALKAKEDFHNKMGKFEDWVQKDPDWIRLTNNIDTLQQQRPVPMGAITRTIEDFEDLMRRLDEEWVRMAKSAYGNEMKVLTDNINDVGQMMTRRINPQVGYQVDEFGIPTQIKSTLDNYRSEAFTTHDLALSADNAKWDLNSAIPGTKRKKAIDFRTDPFGSAQVNTQFYDDFYKAVDDELSRVRTFGNETLNYNKTGAYEHNWQRDADIRNIVDKQSSKLPDDWIKALNGDPASLDIVSQGFTYPPGTYYTKLPKQDTLSIYEGYVSAGEKTRMIRANQYYVDSFGVADETRLLSFDINNSQPLIRTSVTHELGHAVDDVVPGLSDVNATFLKNRIDPGLNDINRGMANIEGQGRWLDKFTEDYVGTDYNGTQVINTETFRTQGARMANPSREARSVMADAATENHITYGPPRGPAGSEVTSTGIQSVLRATDHASVSNPIDLQMAAQSGPLDMVADQDYFSHILGVLAVM